MPPDHRRGSAQRLGAGEAGNKGVEGPQYSTPTTPDNQAVVVQHTIVALIRTSENNWLMLIDWPEAGPDARLVIPVHINHICIGGFRYFRKYVREKYGFDFEPLTMHEWQRLIARAFQWKYADWRAKS